MCVCVCINIYTYIHVQTLTSPVVNCRATAQGVVPGAWPCFPFLSWYTYTLTHYAQYLNTLRPCFPFLSWYIYTLRHYVYIYLNTLRPRLRDSSAYGFFFWNIFFFPPCTHTGIWASGLDLLRLRIRNSRCC